MNDKDYKLAMAFAKKQRKEVTASKEAAKKFLIEMDLLTPTGRWKKQNPSSLFANLLY